MSENNRTIAEPYTLISMLSKSPLHTVLYQPRRWLTPYPKNPR